MQSELFYCYKDSKLNVKNYEEVHSLLYNPKTWYILDAVPPRPKLKAITVLAVSPISYKQDKFYDEFSKVVVNRYCMAREELMVCRTTVYPQVLEELMFRIYDHTGGVPRYVLKMLARLIVQTQDKELIIQQSLARIHEAVSSI